MSAPRKPFGARQPGRLPATMMKVLAAEMSDPGRLRRGKQYAHDGSVVDIVVEPGVVTCEVLGSRPTPYVASIEVTAGDGMPLRRDVVASCSCPDAEDDWGVEAGGSDICKHVVAAMFVFSDELLIEPELLDVWRRRDPAARGDVGAAPPPDPAADRLPAGASPQRDRHTRRHLRVVRLHERAPSDADDEPSQAHPAGDRLAALLRVPTGRTIPAVPDVETVDVAGHASGELARTVRDAISVFRFDWD